MQREPLLGLLDGYARAHPHESPCVERIRALVRSRADCFERSCLPGHVTASAWILSADRQRFLLTHHRKLGRWLQLGGHADGDPDVLGVALREAREESGMHDFSVVCGAGAGTGRGARGTATVVPIDLDVHVIPARGADPEHEHHDVRFLLVAAPDQPLCLSDESHDLAWFAVTSSLDELGADESLLRLARKAAALREAAALPLP